MGRAERALVPVVLVVGAVGLVAGGLLPAPVLVLSVPFLVLLWRSAVQRRLAFRNASRRPRETALVILGALLGTAIITGSAVVGDTLESSIRRGAYTKLGPVDEVVRVSGPERQAEILAAVRSVAEGNPRIDGVLPLSIIAAAVATPETGEERRAEPSATVLEVDFDAAAGFGSEPDIVGLSGPTPAPGQAVVGEDLAERLDVGPGDQVVLFAYGAERAFTVDRVVERLGVAGFSLAFGSESPNLFVPPGTLAELAAGAPPGTAPPASLVAVSNAGGVLDGNDHTAAVVPELEAALEGLPASVNPAKRDLLRDSELTGQQFTEMFTALGFFGVLAGVLLLVNIFVMLAQERTTELGMLRAIGLRRRGLVGFFSTEGWLYSLAAATVGTVAGLGVGWLIVLFAARIFASGDFGLEVRYTATLQSVQAGFTTGFVMSLVTVLATSLWIARLNVIAAIRDLPTDRSRRGGLLRLAAGAVAIVVGGLQLVSGLSQANPFLLLGGPAFLGVGTVALLGRLLPSRPLNTLVSAAVLLWSIFAFDIVPEAFDNPEIFLFVVDGVILTVSAVALVAQNQELLVGLVRRLGGGRATLPIRLGLAYPLARRFRTSLILAMFALVMFTLTSITLFSDVFSRQIDDFTADVSGGHTLRVFSNGTNPVPAAEVAQIEGVTAVNPVLTAGAEFRLPSVTGDDFQVWPVAGYGEGFVTTGPPSVDESKLAPGMDPADLWRVVLSNPNAVIVNEFFLQNGGGPPEGRVDVGDRLTVRNPSTGATRELRVVGMADASFDFGPAFVGAQVVRDLFGDRAVENMLYVDTAAGVDPQDLAERLNGLFLANGADATSFRASVAEGLAQQQQFFQLMQGYLALGLVVGIAGIGVVMVRAVRERRREVGVLRSLGFDAVQVRRAFIAESAFVAVEGIVIGVGLAVALTWRLLGAGAFGDGLEFRIPWFTLAVILALSFGASLLATAAPAQQASRIRPAVALRITD